MKPRNLAKIKVALELIVSGYQMLEDTIRVVEIDALSEKVNDVKPLKQTSPRKKGNQSS